MKDIGFTENGGRLVEMSQEEYAQLTRLCLAVENKPIYHIQLRSPREFNFTEEYDFSNTFEVIRAFYDARFRITELQRQIDAMKESLSK